MEKRYEEIIGRGRRYSPKHPPMPNRERAVQFAPFAALDGHGDALLETARVTEHETELTEEEKTMLDRRLQKLQEQLCGQPEITVGYFKPDERKTGGAYLVRTARLKQIEEHPAALHFTDGSSVAIEQIRWVEQNTETPLEKASQPMEWP